MPRPHEWAGGDGASGEILNLNLDYADLFLITLIRNNVIPLNAATQIPVLQERWEREFPEGFPTQSI